MKIKGISVWIWALGVVVVGSSVALINIPSPTGDSERLEIIQKGLFSRGDFYEVRGQIFNPRKTPARNVRLTFQIAERSITRNNEFAYKPVTKAIAEFDYVPVGGTVDFTAGASMELDSAKKFYAITNWTFSEGEINESGNLKRR